MGECVLRPHRALPSSPSSSSPLSSHPASSTSPPAPGPARTRRPRCRGGRSARTAGRPLDGEKEEEGACALLRTLGVCACACARVADTGCVCVCVCRREEDGSREESEFFSSAHSSLRVALPPAPPSPGAPSAPSCRPGNHHTLLCTAVHTPGRAAPALHPPPRLHPPLSPMSDHRVRRAQCRRAGPTLVHPDPRQQGGRPRVGAGSLWFWGAASLRCRSPPSPPLPPRPPSSPTHSRPGVMVTTSGTTAGATR